MADLFHYAVKGADLSATLRTGVIPLPLTEARELSGGAFINAAGIGGILASDTTPTLTFNNGGARASWAATNVDVIAWQTIAPVDFDPTGATVVKIIASMAATNDTPTLTVGFYEGMLNTDEGGATTAVSGTTPTVKTRTIAAGELAGGNQWNISITPGAHGTDILRIDAVWIEYQRR